MLKMDDHWIDAEIDPGVFPDIRLARRLRLLLGQLARAPGQSLPLVCQDWANTKAAYRFLSNDRVDEAQTLAGHLAATRRRMALANDKPVLILHDTTEFSWTRKSHQPIGMLGLTNSGRDSQGRSRLHTVCGLLMHSSLAVTCDGLSLGLAAIKFWSRAKFKGTNALKRSINPTRVPIEHKESICWLDNLWASTAWANDSQEFVHIGDRESDIYELFCKAREAGDHFIFRTCADRLAGDGHCTVAQYMDRVRCQGLHRVQVRDARGNRRQAAVELKYCLVPILPPRAKQSRYPALTLTVLQARERRPPSGVAPIDWKLITDLPVRSLQEAIDKLQWYAMRWKIETFHKILKSGCRAEESHLRTAQRLTNRIALMCVLGWRIFWLTMMNRVAPDGSAGLVLTQQETNLLAKLARQMTPPARLTVRHCVNQLARLGGYLARAHDPPPGNMVVWRGMARLTDIELGFNLAGRICG